MECLDPWAGGSVRLGSSRDSKGAPHHQGPLEAGGALGPVLGAPRALRPLKEGLGSMHEPWSRKPSEPLGFTSHKAELLRGSSQSIRAGADLHMQEQGSLCIAVRRAQELLRTKAKPGQSCCSAGQQPQGPRPQQPAAKQSHGQEEGQGEGCAASTCPSPHPISTHHAWSKHTEHPPAHRASPSLRLQRHSTLQPPGPRSG